MKNLVAALPTQVETNAERIVGVGSFGNDWPSELSQECKDASKYLSVNPRGPASHYHFMHFGCMIQPVKD